MPHQPRIDVCQRRHLCALNMPKSTGPVAGMARVTAENILRVLDGKPNRDNAINPKVLG